jgi:hypothetical protein
VFSLSPRRNSTEIIQGAHASPKRSLLAATLFFDQLRHDYDARVTLRTGAMALLSSKRALKCPPGGQALLVGRHLEVAVARRD